jgi:hypothetical protein
MLSQHPANLLLRFSLEIIALIGVGQWAWGKATGPAQLIFAVALPLIFVVMWMVFTTPGEPGRKNRSLVPVPGWVRLLLEAVLFIFALFCFFSIGQEILTLALIFALLLHYFWSAERVVWLLRN